MNQDPKHLEIASPEKLTAGRSWALGRVARFWRLAIFSFALRCVWIFKANDTLASISASQNPFQELAYSHTGSMLSHTPEDQDGDSVNYAIGLETFDRIVEWSKPVCVEFQQIRVSRHLNCDHMLAATVKSRLRSK